MCIGDWRIGRFITSANRQVILNNGVADAIGASRQRVGLMINLDIGGTSVGTRAQISVNGQIFASLNQSNAYFKCTLQDDGNLPQQAFSVLAVGATVTYGVTELFLPENILEMGYQAFLRSIGK